MNPVPSDIYSRSMTLARLTLARKGLHPDLLPRPPLETEYLLAMREPEPLTVYLENKA